MRERVDLQRGGRVLTEPRYRSPSTFLPTIRMEHMDPQALEYAMTSPECVKYIEHCRTAPRTVNVTQAALRTGFNATKLYRMIQQGYGPRPIGPAPYRFTVEELDRWMDEYGVAWPKKERK
ncbi:MAG: hypothetical protein SOI13_01360 [Bifidobacterium mongoliense]|jgi:predicted DNA-binding transcriptional regulator AlpA|uniref:helix-turn-helix transcriptional regulator n=1 Tax=Bifidobacterium mongoliense TaxID=518643 RepID=UPI002F355F4B